MIPHVSVCPMVGAHPPWWAKLAVWAIWEQHILLTGLWFYMEVWHTSYRNDRHHSVNQTGTFLNACGVSCIWPSVIIRSGVAVRWLPVKIVGTCCTGEAYIEIPYLREAKANQAQRTKSSSRSRGTEGKGLLSWKPLEPKIGIVPVGGHTRELRVLQRIHQL